MEELRQQAQIVQFPKEEDRLNNHKFKFKVLNITNSQQSQESGDRKKEEVIIFITQGTHSKIKHISPIVNAFLNSTESLNSGQSKIYFQLRLYVFQFDYFQPAFSKEHLQEQSTFIHDTISYIMQNVHKDIEFHTIGHSMGGNMQYIATTMANYPVKQLKSMISISSPLKEVPQHWGTSVNSYYYESMVKIQNIAHIKNEVVHINCNGGAREFTVHEMVSEFREEWEFKHVLNFRTAEMINLYSHMSHNSFYFAKEFLQEYIPKILKLVMSHDKAENRLVLAQEMFNGKRTFSENNKQMQIELEGYEINNKLKKKYFIDDRNVTEFFTFDIRQTSNFHIFGLINSNTNIQVFGLKDGKFYTLLNDTTDYRYYKENIFTISFDRPMHYDYLIVKSLRDKSSHIEYKNISTEFVEIKELNYENQFTEYALLFKPFSKLEFQKDEYITIFHNFPYSYTQLPLTICSIRPQTLMASIVVNKGEARQLIKLTQQSNCFKTYPAKSQDLNRVEDTQIIFYSLHDSRYWNEVSIQINYSQLIKDSIHRNIFLILAVDLLISQRLRYKNQSKFYLFQAFIFLVILVKTIIYNEQLRSLQYLGSIEIGYLDIIVIMMMGNAMKFLWLILYHLIIKRIPFLKEYSFESVHFLSGFILSMADELTKEYFRLFESPISPITSMPSLEFIIFIVAFVYYLIHFRQNQNRAEERGYLIRLGSEMIGVLFLQNGLLYLWFFLTYPFPYKYTYESEDYMHKVKVDLSSSNCKMLNEIYGYTTYLVQNQSIGVTKRNIDNSLVIFFFHGSHGHIDTMNAFQNGFKEQMLLSKPQIEIIVYSFDVKMQPSAFTSHILIHQAHYASEAIYEIMKSFHPTSSYVLIGHSMGGVVAYLTQTEFQFIQETPNLRAIITLASPINETPLYTNTEAQEILDIIHYDALHKFQGIQKLSIDGGIADLQCPPNIAHIQQLKYNARSISSEYMKGIESPIDHRALIRDKRVTAVTSKLIIDWFLSKFDSQFDFGEIYFPYSEEDFQSKNCTYNSHNEDIWNPVKRNIYPIQICSKHSDIEATVCLDQSKCFNLQLNNSCKNLNYFAQGIKEVRIFQNKGIEDRITVKLNYREIFRESLLRTFWYQIYIAQILIMIKLAVGVNNFYYFAPLICFAKDLFFVSQLDMWDYITIYFIGNLICNIYIGFSSVVYLLSLPLSFILSPSKLKFILFVVLFLAYDTDSFFILSFTLIILKSLQIMKVQLEHFLLSFFLRYLDFIVYDYWRFVDMQQLYLKDLAPRPDFNLHIIAYFFLIMRYLFFERKSKPSQLYQSSSLVNILVGMYFFGKKVEVLRYFIQIQMVIEIGMN